MDDELELTTDGSDIYISRKTEPFIICAVSLTSATVKSDGMCVIDIQYHSRYEPLIAALSCL